MENNPSQALCDFALQNPTDHEMLAQLIPIVMELDARVASLEGQLRHMKEPSDHERKACPLCRKPIEGGDWSRNDDGIVLHVECHVYLSIHGGQ